MSDFHPKIEEALKHSEHGTIIDGVFCSEAIDTSGESIDIKEMDISSLNDGSGVANTEHISPDDKQFKDAPKDEIGQWAVIVGRIIFAKKIFGLDDCETDRERDFWEDLELPFVYGAVELFDADDHLNAQELAAIVRHYHKRGLPVVARFSIEGSTLGRDGNILKPTIARRVAITIKPCSHAAVSSLVAETNVSPYQHKKVEKSEKYIGSYETECYPLILELDPVDELRKGVDELRKTLSLGNSNVAPTSLTGGAALASEQLVGKKTKEKMYKAALFAAIRDWNRVTDFKKHLKHYLKDVDDRFIDKFAQMGEDIVLGKVAMSLHKAEEKPKESPKSKSIKYHGKLVSPGEVQIIAGPFSGSKLRLFHLDPDYAHVEAFKSGGQESTPINKLPRKHEGINWVMTKPPDSTYIPLLINSQKHGHEQINKRIGQSAILDGLNLGRPEHDRAGLNETQAVMSKDDVFGWHSNSVGHKVLVKPVIESDWDTGKKVSSAKREAMTHTLAEEFFGLSGYVPTTSVFNHPDTQREHSAMSMVPDAEHFYHHNSNLRGNKVLKDLGNSGELDKLAIMDIVLGHGDRNSSNYLISPSGKRLHLIDNAAIFNFNSRKLPSYLLDFHKVTGNPIDKQPIHPEASHWLMKLSPFELKDKLLEMGVPEEYAGEASKRLVSMQSAVSFGKTNKLDILFAHDHFTQPVSPNVEEPEGNI